MNWLIIALISYFILGAVSLGDKFLLSGKPNPKVYAFYVGLLGGLVFLLIPFVGFYIPTFAQIILSLVSGAFSIFALYFLFKGLEYFEASRIVPAMGGLIPVFTLSLFFIFSKGKEFLNFTDNFAFILLVLGSVVITYEKNVKISFASLLISFIAALFFAFHFVLSKYIYLEQPFWNGFIIMRIGAFITALFFVFTKDVRKELFFKKPSFNKKTGSFFILNQTAGAGAFILQHFAVYLAGISYVSIVMALQGAQYVFIFIFSLLLSIKAPWVIKEDINKNILFQKTLAILFIFSGLIILNLNG